MTADFGAAPAFGIGGPPFDQVRVIAT